MTNHGQDRYGRDITSEDRPGGVTRYSVTRDGVGILFVECPTGTAFSRVLMTIEAHEPTE